MSGVFFAKEVKGPMHGQELARRNQKFQKRQYPAAKLHAQKLKSKREEQGVLGSRQQTDTKKMVFESQ